MEKVMMGRYTIMAQTKKSKKSFLEKVWHSLTVRTPVKTSDLGVSCNFTVAYPPNYENRDYNKWIENIYGQLF
jgi:hypothetical protein